MGEDHAAAGYPLLTPSGIQDSRTTPLDRFAADFNTVQVGIVPVELINACMGSTQGQIYLEFSM
jgi:hypothetical protein